MRALINCLVVPSMAVLMCVSAGCGGGPDRPKTVAVTGKVTSKGQPVTSGTVAFVPTAANGPRPASGEIDSSGNYKLMTFEPGDGALPGEYKVSISSFTGADPATKSEGKKALPDKYYRADTSGLTASIKPGDSAKVFDFKAD